MIMTEQAKNVLSWLNDWALLLQLAVTVLAFGFFFFHIERNVSDIKELQQQNNDAYQQNHMFYMSSIQHLLSNDAALQAALTEKANDHKDFRRGQAELVRVMDRLVIVLDSVDQELKRRRK